MYAIEKLINWITMANERYGFLFLGLMLAMTYQLIIDVLFWEETRNFYDHREVVVSTLFIVAIWVYKIWKKSEYRLRTVVATLLVLNTIGDVVCTYAQIPLQRGLLIPIDILWILGLVTLRFGGPEKKPFLRFTYKEM